MSAELPIQNLLDQGKEYLLGVCAELSDRSEIWYYMRIMEQDQDHVNGMLALAEEFSSKTYKYSDAQSLTMYMETSPRCKQHIFRNCDAEGHLFPAHLGISERGAVRRGIHKIKGTVRKPCQRGDHVPCDGEEW